jgi:hypothetical protein
MLGRLSISTRFAFVFLVAIGMVAAAFYMILDRIYLNQLKRPARLSAGGRGGGHGLRPEARALLLQESGAGPARVLGGRRALGVAVQVPADLAQRDESGQRAIRAIPCPRRPS